MKTMKRSSSPWLVAGKNSPRLDGKKSTSGGVVVERRKSALPDPFGLMITCESFTADIPSLGN